MFKHLSIINYALIEHIELDFLKGFTTITGETGSGKSIILEAVSLLNGERADSQALYDKTKKCIVEGCFDINKYNLRDFFNKNNLDYDDQLILRREISPEGKSRAFINDTPVNLSQLREVSSKLMNLHSQHSTMEVMGKDFQLFIVDCFSDTLNDFQEYQRDYQSLMQLKKQLESLVLAEKQARSDADYYNFLFNELEMLNIKENEQAQLEHEGELLSNVEQIKSNLAKALDALYEGENNCLHLLSFVLSQMSQISRYDSGFSELNNRMQSLYLELKDVVDEIQRVDNATIMDPQRLEEINLRLNEIYRLQHKHSVNSTEELIVLKKELDQKIQGFQSLSNQIDIAEKEILSREAEILSRAKLISEKRKKSFKDIEKLSVSMLKMLGIPDADLKIINQTSSSVTLKGIDEIFFIFSANKGSELKPISENASGGELSRLMLIFKSLISKKMTLPTIFFDEIDTGMSGEIATKTGNIMKDLSADMQVFAVTHLAQIASQGQQHYLVYKVSGKDSTRVNVKLLSGEERIQTIAEMLSSKKITEASKAIARQLLS